MDARLKALADELRAYVSDDGQTAIAGAVDLFDGEDPSLARAREAEFSGEALHHWRCELAARGEGIPYLHDEAKALTAACRDGRWKQACVIVERLVGRLELGEWRPDQFFLLPGRVQHADGPAPLRQRIEHLRSLADANRRRSSWPRDERHTMRRQHPSALGRAREIARRCGL